LERPTGEIGSSSSANWPTPKARDHHGESLAAGLRRYLGGRGGLGSQTAVRLWPTARATDGTKGGPNQAGSSGDLMLPSAVQAWRENPEPWASATPGPAEMNRHSPDLLAMVAKNRPTPRSFDAHDIRRSPEPRANALTKGGCANPREVVQPSEARCLSPMWVCCLMGLPPDWLQPVTPPRRGRSSGPMSRPGPSSPSPAERRS
jgi:hypothetical protein